MTARIGIYGGGQLAAYLCQAARTLGLSSSVLAFSEDSMAKWFADRCIVAPNSDMQALCALLASSDVLTFDLEDVPAAALNEIAEQAAAGRIAVAPSVAVMRLLQDKHAQKQWLQQQGFPTLDFVACTQSSGMAEVEAILGFPFIQKMNRGGYDGKGVQLIRGASEADTFWCQDAFAERYLKNKRELCVLVARGLTGQSRSYPAVEMLFDEAGHVLQLAQAPAAISRKLEQRAQELADDIVQRLGGVGVFAIEMFVTQDEQLLVNEISPRVHNTGHLTIEASVTSQYEQHLRAITGQPLGDVSQNKAAVMCNILCTDGLKNVTNLSCGTTRWTQHSNVHWYGKQGGKPGRKMGHITSLGEDVATARQRAHAAMAGLTAAHGEVG